MLSTFALAFIVCLSMVSNGFALKCYTCEDKDSCKSPTEATCKGEGNLPVPDSCWLHRETAYINGTNVVIKDKRSCKYSYRCIKAYHCKGTEDNVTCEAGCCKDDLCNHHKFVPEEPKYYKPSGSDLSCYSCSDLPGDVLKQNLPVAKAKCTKPAKKTCGVSMLEKTLKQDRCITLKVKEKRANSETKEMEFRTCADMSFCSMNEVDWNFALHDEMGTLPTVKASCCHGNLCNTGYKTQAISGLTCLSSLAVMIIGKWLVI